MNKLLSLMLEPYIYQDAYIILWSRNLWCLYRSAWPMFCHRCLVLLGLCWCCLLNRCLFFLEPAEVRRSSLRLLCPIQLLSLLGRALKWMLSCFEQLFGLKINYDKSDLVLIGMDHEETRNFAQIFCCKIWSFPFKYLGLPFTIVSWEAKICNRWSTKF